MIWQEVWWQSHYNDVRFNIFVILQIKRGLKYVSSFDDERIKRGAKEITTEEEMVIYQILFLN